MTFQNLRTGSTVYIFHKDSSPKLEIGQVTTEPKVRPKYQTPSQIPAQPYANYMPQPQEQVVDVSIRIGDRIQPIEGLPVLADTQDCGNGLFISCNRDAINAEVSTYMHISEAAIADEVINAHRQIVESCKSILVTLNPEIAERQRAEAENKELKNELREMKGMMASLLEQLGSSTKK